MKMMKLPLFISVPHAGTLIPPEVMNLSILHPQDILADHDAGAYSIYFALEDYAVGFCTTAIARSMVDLNRSPEEIGGDGVIKSHTCWNVPVYSNFPDENLIRDMLDKYYFPYHEKLTAAASHRGIRLGIDCHTMSAVGPPVGPDPGQERPLICVSNADGTCPREWITALAKCLEEVFRERVAINIPFRGGYITRFHAAEMPWLQVEISRTSSYSNEEKRACLLDGLERFCQIFQ